MTGNLYRLADAEHAGFRSACGCTGCTGAKACSLPVWRHSKAQDSESLVRAVAARALDMSVRSLHAETGGWHLLDGRLRLLEALVHDHPASEATTEDILRTTAHEVWSWWSALPIVDPLDPSDAVQAFNKGGHHGKGNVPRAGSFPLGLAHLAVVNVHRHGRLSAQLWLGRWSPGDGFAREDMLSLRSVQALLTLTLPFLPASDDLPETQGLTSRQMDVAREAAAGATNKEIAAALHMSTGTVRTHLHRIYSRLGVHTRAELASRLAPPRTSFV